MGALVSSMGSESEFNVMLLGLKGAGKTHLMYNVKLDDAWKSEYDLGPDKEAQGNPKNSQRKDDMDISKKYVALLPTSGFN